MRMFDVQGIEIRAPRGKCSSFCATLATCRNGRTHSRQPRMVGPGSRRPQEPATHRLYASHATKIVVADTETGNLIGEIPDLAGVHGIALAPDLGRGFSSNGRANTSTIVDLKTLKPLGTVATGANPDSVKVTL